MSVAKGKDRTEMVVAEIAREWEQDVLMAAYKRKPINEKWYGYIIIENLGPVLAQLELFCEH